MRTKWIAFLFAWFLGSIGIHKFYLGQTGWGIVYLLFFWTGIPMIVGWIEGVIYLTMADADFNRLFNGGQVLISAETTRDKALALQEVKRLYDEGIITAGEYEQKRRKLLDLI